MLEVLIERHNHGRLGHGRLGHGRLGHGRLGHGRLASVQKLLLLQELLWV
jgi:hypothetical protein